MMNVQLQCSTCNSIFYVSNIISIGRTSTKTVPCPICHSNNFITTSGIPTVSKTQLRKVCISSFLQQTYGQHPMFHNCIYHITSSNNIPLIQQNGLSPYAILKNNGIEVTTGGDTDSLNLDQFLGLDKYIHLSFTQWCPMFAEKEAKGENLYRLSISLDVLDQPDVLFCNKIATSNDAVFYDYINTTTFDLEAVYGYLDWSSPDGQKRRNVAEKYEILVPNTITPDMILDYSLIE